MNLTEFLMARISEDYADAMVGWRWKALPAGEYTRLQARVLAECEAKRRIVEEHKQVRDSYEPTDEDTGCQTCDWDSDCQVVMTNPEPGCLTLRLLALPYADHEAYDPAWRP